MTAPLILPPALAPGDRVVVVSTSYPGPAAHPSAYRRGLAALARLGLSVVAARHTAGRGRDWLSGTAQERADDLHAAFTDPRVRAVINTIGGNHTAQLLPLLDLDLMRANPTIFCGYSDATVLNLALHRAALVTFYGPAVIPQWGVVGGPLPYMVEQFTRVLFDPTPPGPVPRAAYEVHDEDHARAEATGQPVRRSRTVERHVLRPGTATGPLLPACLPSVRLLIGTEWEPSWSGRLLVLDTPGSGYGPADADADLLHLAMAGVLADLAGLVICKPLGHTPEQAAQLVEIVRERVRGTGYPVLFGLEGGHTNPLPTLPVGVRATLADHELVLDHPCVLARS